MNVRIGRRKEIKTRILETSEELFSVKGYEGTSISSIAKKSGITKSLIYYYFENKEDIMKNISRRAR